MTARFHRPSRGTLTPLKAMLDASKEAEEDLRAIDRIEERTGVRVEIPGRTPEARADARAHLERVARMTERLTTKGRKIPAPMPPARAAWEALVRLQEAVEQGSLADLDEDQRERLGAAYRVLAEIAILEVFEEDTA